MESREQIIARVMQEYDQHLAEWRAARPAPAPTGDEFYRPSRRITIEREPARVVYRSIHPYVGIVPLHRRKA